MRLTDALSWYANYDWVDLTESMITVFFNDHYSNHSINTFCDTEIFTWAMQWVLDTWEKEDLLSTGTKVLQVQPSQKPAKDKDVARDIIMNRKYTEQELTDKMTEFRSRN